MFKTNPQWSTCLCFCEGIHNQAFTRRTIAKWFYKLVSADDYFIEDGLQELLDFLYSVSNPDDVGEDIAGSKLREPKRGPWSASQVVTMAV